MAASIDELTLKAGVDAVLNRWPVAGLAVGVVRDGSARRLGRVKCMSCHCEA